MKDRIFYYSALISIVLFNLLIIYVFFVLVWPFKVVEFNKFQTVNDTIKQGNNVCVDMSFTKYMPLKAAIEWSYVDGVVYAIDADRSIYRGVGYNNTVRCFEADIPPGEYRVHLELHYELLGGLRELNYTKESNKFTVK